jgi:hypothetical protein
MLAISIPAAVGIGAVIAVLAAVIVVFSRDRKVS